MTTPATAGEKGKRLVHHSKVELIATVVLNESEMAALDAIAGYGVDDFLRVFYSRLGETYLKPHEAGLRSLFATIRDEVPGLLSRARKAREAFVPLPPSAAPASKEGE